MSFPQSFIGEGSLGVAVEVLLNRAISTQGLMVRANNGGASIAVPTGTWTQINLTAIGFKTHTGATLNSGRLVLPATSDGRWIGMFSINWENDVASLPIHRRKIRGTTGGLPIIQAENDAVFLPTMGDLAVDSVLNGTGMFSLPVFALRDCGVQVWHNAGIDAKVNSLVLTMYRLGDTQSEDT